MKNKITLTKILSFIEGTVKAKYDQYIGSPKHIKEQVIWRLSQCDDCIEREGCQYCNCPPAKKAFVNKSCNGGARFPDLMNETEWNNYKKKRNIAIDDTGI